MRLKDWNEIESVRGELAIHRVRTVGLLRKYLRMAAEAGRLPSLVGREFFRTTVTSYNTQTFEDTIVFVIDMERILEALDEEARRMIAFVIFQEYTHEEAADLLTLRRSYFGRRFAQALDRLTRLLIQRGLLDTINQSVSFETVDRQQRVQKFYNTVERQDLPKSVYSPIKHQPKFCQARKMIRIAVTR